MMDLESILTLVAIIVGPLSAVLVTYWMQKRDHIYQRQMHIFRILMANRQTPLNFERIQALNLVEVDFSKNKGVLEAYKKLIDTYDEKHSDNDQNVRNIAFNKSKEANAFLISKIADSLGYKIQQLDALSGGYVPVANTKLEEEQIAIRSFVVGLSNGVMSVPVTIVDVPKEK